MNSLILRPLSYNLNYSQKKFNYLKKEEASHYFDFFQSPKKLYIAQLTGSLYIYSSLISKTVLHCV